MIKVDKLYKTFEGLNKQKVNAINESSITFYDKGLVCILGESGSGKTTFLNVISGLDDFDSGKISVDGQDMIKYNAKIYEQLRIRKFGYIFQNYLLIEELTVKQNVSTALDLYDMDEKERENRITDVLKALQMEKYSEKQVSELSGGQKQRVAIARAIVKTSNVIFADEPTGNLDAVNSIMIMEIMKKLSEHCLILMVTHDKEMAEAYADRLITISDGNIISDVKNEKTSSIEYSMGTNIVLEGKEKTEIQNEFCDLNFWGKPDYPIKMDIIYQNGKYYIDLKENKQEPVVVDQNSAIQIYEKAEDNKEKYTFDYEAKKINSTLKSFPVQVIKRIISILSETMGKRKGYIGGLLFINGIILIAVLALFFTAKYPDKSKIVNSDSHYISIDFELGKGIGLVSMDDVMEGIYNKVEKKYGKKNLMFDFKKQYVGESRKYYEMKNLVFYGDNYNQMQLQSQEVKDFSYVPTTYLKESDMICGKNKNDMHSIVLDKWLADRLIKSNSLVFKSYRSYEDFVGKKVAIGTKDFVVTITGICKTNQPSIYANRDLLFEIDEWTEMLPYEDINVWGYIKKNRDDSEKIKKLDQKYYNILKLGIIQSKNMVLYSNDIEKDLKYFNELTIAQRKHSLQMTVHCKAKEELEAYQNKYKSMLQTFEIVAAATILLSLFIMFFMVQSCIDKQKGVFTIYMINGIRRKDLVRAYILQNCRIMLFSAVPAILLSSIILWNAEFLGLTKTNIELPVAAVCILILLFFLINYILIVGILERYLKKPLAHQGLI